MVDQTAAEAKEKYIKVMGEELGTQYAELWQELAQLNIRWLEFIELYGTKKSRIELMNRSTGHFFRMVQDCLWEGLMLHIARLTDRPVSFGRTNLTLHNLPALIPDVALKRKLEALCLDATNKTKFARDWRNRHIAHRDLDLALGTTAKPLPAVEIRQVNDALGCFTEILNSIAGPYLHSTTSFKHGVRLHGAIELLYLLDDGHALQAERRRRLDAGDYSPELSEANDV
ncbi:hypothetical protein RX330_02535 [Bradyrhizobium sp. NDS-1]|uniref:AbiU2 domain-containing protein n=1 Tax=Bradyrhizobium sp. NDS-1 TaxID=3080014 RepID=UPI00293ED184|nr:hypothetical protein [Bradyrhizobium sp. NDS-1]WOH74020.1 hypothetical protein RX330_02535 [Bradyrhizobium sp. NDS-1]